MTADIALSDGAEVNACAVKLTAGPPAMLAVSRLRPGALPSVHEPTWATPFAFVVAAAPATLPPPSATANVTPTPGTGLPKLSSTCTLGGGATAWPTSARNPCCPAERSETPVPATPVAVTVIDTDVPDTVARSVLAPGVVPRIHSPTVARLLTSVTAESPITVPPPLAIVNRTRAPETALPPSSWTRTAGAVVTLLPTGACWLAPATMLIAAGAPATTSLLRQPDPAIKSAVARIRMWLCR